MLRQGVPGCRSSGAEPAGRVEAGELPGGKVLVDIHEGSYETIADTYNRMMAYMKEKDLADVNVAWEFYLNDPNEVPPEELKTEIYFLLKG
jgi:AraC family transcriptional regulator